MSASRDVRALIALSFAVVAAAATAQTAPARAPGASAPREATAPAASASSAAAVAKPTVQAAAVPAPKAVAVTEGMTLAEYADALNRKARNDALGPTQPMPQPLPTVIRRPERVDPLAGWRYIGYVDVGTSGYIYGELVAPNGQRVGVYKGDRIMPGYTISAIGPSEISIACPAPVVKPTSRKASKATDAGCVQTIRRS